MAKRIFKILTKSHIIFLSLFCISLLLMTYELGKDFLFPWDEAWYADIARNILNSGQIFLMQHNGRPYYDHPQLGFWAIALSFKILGVSEFSARLPMALAGALSVGTIFLIGQKLHSINVGIISALILLSSRWFLLRTRTSNLDSLLVLCQLLFFYFIVTATTPVGFYLMCLFFGLSLLTKSVISLTLFPLIFFKTGQLYVEKKINLTQIGLGIGLLLIVLLPFYLINYWEYGIEFLNRNFITIGTRGLSSNGVGIESISKTFLYLNSAIHKWYKPMFLSLFISLFFVKKWQVRLVLIFFGLSFFPYLLSNQTEIWHLIPVIPSIALVIGLSFILFINFIFKLIGLNKIINFTSYTFVTLILLISLISIKSYLGEFIANRSSTPQVVILAKLVKNSSLPLVLSDDQYLPSIVFYATPETYKPSVHFYDLDSEYVNCNFANNYQGKMVSLWNGITKNESGCKFSEAFLLIAPKNFQMDRNQIVIAENNGFELLQVSEKKL